MYLNWVYDKDVVQELVGSGKFFGDIGVIDVSSKLSANHIIRIEAQALPSKQDTRNWATGLIESTFAPNWFLAVIDQYNLGNSDEAKQIHYVTTSTDIPKMIIEL